MINKLKESCLISEQIMKYDRGQIAAFYDVYGEKEWERLTKDPAALVSLHIHQHYLKKYVTSGDSILEVGAGAG